jgi:uncharacterized membrane protein HdeD (DUF308 family)
MSTLDSPGRGLLRHELGALRGEWAWFLALGIGLIVLGMIALGASVVATFLTVVLYGVLLLAGGALQIVGAFWSREWSGFFLHVLAGALYLVVGLFFVRDPGDAALAMTLLLAAFLLVSGIFRIAAAIVVRFPLWGWAIASGALNVLLGLLIWAQWPFSGLWVIGLFIGIEMVFSGWTFVLLGLAMRKLPRAAG